MSNESIMKNKSASIYFMSKNIHKYIIIPEHEYDI